MMEEVEFRKTLQETLALIEASFEDVDPDIVECENQFGALTIKLANGARCILSAQPSVRQLWLAVASRGVAFHFNYDGSKSQWLDDKGQGIELISYLESYLKESAGLCLAIGG